MVAALLMRVATTGNAPVVARINAAVRAAAAALRQNRRSAR